MRRALGPILLVATLGVTAWGVAPGLRALDARPTASAVDVIPLWCRARVLVSGPDACGPEVMAEVLRKPVAPPRDRSSPYYYPPTAALLFLPSTVGSFDTMVRVFRGLSVLALVGAAFAVVTAAPVRDRWIAGAWGCGLAGLALSLRLVRGSIQAGQTGPLVVGLTAAALWAFARGRDRTAGGIAGVGIALKLFPVLLLPAAVRRWGVIAAAVGTVALLAAATAAFPFPDPPFAWLAGAAEFVDRPMRGAWTQNEPPWVLAAWRWRLLGLGIPTGIVLLLTALRPRLPAGAAPAAAFLAVAWGGTVMAGSPQTHEGLVLLPAVAWVLAAPVQRRETPSRAEAAGWWAGVAMAALVLGAGWFLGVMSPMAPPNSLHWVPMGWIAWVGCLLRWALAVLPDQPQSTFSAQ